MARRSFQDEGEKKPITASNLRKLLGIFRFVLPYKGIFSFGLLALALSSATVLSFPYLAGKLLDVASGKTGFILTSINQIALALLAILLIQGVFSFIRVYTFSIVSERTLADLRQALPRRSCIDARARIDRGLLPRLRRVGRGGNQLRPVLLPVPDPRSATGFSFGRWTCTWHKPLVTLGTRHHTLGTRHRRHPRHPVLFVSQRNHRVDAGGAQRRYPHGDERHDGEHDRHAGEDQRIARAHLEQERRHQPRQSP